MTPSYVLDAWALLAFLKAEEPAASRMRTFLSQAQAGQVSLMLSIVNLGEVFYCIGRLRGVKQAEAVIAMIRTLSLEILPATDARVLAAARLKATRAISYADAFAVTTAMEHSAILLTGDPELMKLPGVTIESLRRE